MSATWSFKAMEISTQESLMSHSAFAMTADSLWEDGGSMIRSTNGVQGTLASPIGNQKVSQSSPPPVDVFAVGVCLGN